MVEDNLSKEGATRLAARLQNIYGTRVNFIVEQDKYGVWGIRSDMVRGCPKDGKGHYSGYSSGVRVNNKPSRKAVPRAAYGDNSVEDIPEAGGTRGLPRNDS